MATAGIAMVSTLSVHADTASNTATRPSGNAPAPMSSQTGTDSTASDANKNMPSTKRSDTMSSNSTGSTTATGANMDTKPANGGTAGGSPDNQGTKAPMSK